jgi:predicted XRE-type DNA-binding protein
MAVEIAVQASSGNVFADLGVENPEEYLAKSELAAEILRIIRRRRLTQAKAGQLLGIRQPKVSDLLRGRLDAFSTDRLLRFITLLGYDVLITLSETALHETGQMRVVGAYCGLSRFAVGGVLILGMAGMAG